MRAIVLRRIQHREYDALVILFTVEKGKVTALVRGLYKPLSKLSPHIVPGALLDVDMVPTGEFFLITHADTVERHAGLWQSAERLFIAQVFLHTAEQLLHVQGRERSGFRLMERFLHALSSFEHVPALYLESGLVSLLSDMGYAFDFHACHICKKESSVCIQSASIKTFWVVYAFGGFVCDACVRSASLGEYHKHTIIPTDIFLLQMLSRSEWVQFPVLALDAEAEDRVAQIVKGMMEQVIEKKVTGWRGTVAELSAAVF